MLDRELVRDQRHLKNLHQSRFADEQDDFFVCLGRAKEVSSGHECFQNCIDRVLSEGY